MPGTKNHAHGFPGYGGLMPTIWPTGTRNWGSFSKQVCVFAAAAERTRDQPRAPRVTPPHPVRSGHLPHRHRGGCGRGPGLHGPRRLAPS